MRRISTVTSLVIVFSMFLLACAEETVKVSKKQTTETYETLESALKSGKLVLCLFHNSKACGCVLRSCKAALTVGDSTAKTLPGNVIYFKVDVAQSREIAKIYKIFNAPTIVIFDKNGKEVSRLQSWQIKKETIEAKLGELANKVKATQHDK